VCRWQRLRQLLEEDREILVCRQRLGFIIREWQQTGRDDDFLLSRVQSCARTRGLHPPYASWYSGGRTDLRNILASRSRR
jgi:hypothetical protein